MQDLTFGEQVKIILSRKDMTIKELAKKIEVRTGRKMSRQNLTQRLGRDNFQEKDMRMIAEILGCPFQLNILDERVLTENEMETGHKAGTISVGSEQAVEKELEESAAGKEPLEKASEEITSEEPIEKEKAEGNTKAHERDITIGELVHIHEELDALMEKNTGKLPVGENHKNDGAMQGDEMYDASEAEEYSQGNRTEHLGGFEEALRENVKEGVTEYTKENIQANMSEPPKERGQENNPGFLEKSQDGMRTGGTKEYGELASEDSSEGEHVEELLQEIESLEKTEKKETVQEERPHGWRAYLKQRFKKLGREQVQTEKEASDTGKEYSEVTQKVGASESVDAAGGYSGSEDSTREYEACPLEADYQGEAFGEDGQMEDYSARAYVGSYSETEYSDGAYEEEYFTVGYSEEAYQEDEEGKGEVNPYTGKEYESNSVRMHPSRIGYVQVYDRGNHEWTDMTEWAFLGYQERKKQLLGKDYDPPIYLD